MMLEHLDVQNKQNRRKCGLGTGTCLRKQTMVHEVTTDMLGISSASVHSILKGKIDRGTTTTK
jgi:hypothetical protein